MLSNSDYNKYDKIYSDRVDYYKLNNRTKTRWDFAVKEIHQFTPKIVLDFGCGDGVLFNEYYSAKVEIIHGVDISALRRARAKDRFPSAIISENIVNINKESVDVVVCLDVLDHLDNPVDTLINFYDRLSKDGYIIASVPNFTRIDRRIKMLFGQVPRTSNTQHLIQPESLLVDGGKLGYYSKHDIEVMLINAGFRNIKFFCYGRTWLSSINMFSGTISWTAQK